MYYYDQRTGLRRMKYQALNYTFGGAVRGALTFPWFLHEAYQYRRAGYPDDYPDITIAHPGGVMKPGIRRSISPLPVPGHPLNLMARKFPYYYDEGGRRVFAMDAFTNWTFSGVLLTMLTLPIAWRNGAWLPETGFPDDAHDSTVVHPGGKLAPGITVSEEPRPMFGGQRLRLSNDPESLGFDKDGNPLADFDMASAMGMKEEGHH